MRAHHGLVAAAAILLTAVLAAPATADPRPSAPKPTANPWQMRHWPRTQPWQRGQDARTAAGPRAIDPQNYELPDTMTWDDYKKIPGTNWADPAVKGSVRNFKGAVVLVDYPNQDFVITKPKNSTIFGNPSSVGDVPRDQVPAFYQDFLNKPQDLNHGHTLHEYWMEDSGGRYGVDLTGYGVYRMPHKDHEYGVDGFQQGTGCPAGDTCNRDIRADARAAWLADVGADVAAQYDFVFFLSAGQDESSTWQEFGQMKFASPEAVPAEWGPGDPALPNWVKTRYVDWTSWQAGSTIWPNAVTGSSTQAESSGMAVFAHEFSHILGIGDNYNNPYSVPPRRDYNGPWDMLSRGSFNGPGGPHSRWTIPAVSGASMGSQHMLRNKLKLGIVDPAKVLQLTRDGIASSGVVVATVTAREVEPGSGGLTGVNLKLGDGGDRSPACDTAADPMCDGGRYDNYTVEVVDRMGFDSFTPDSGVLLAKTKDRDSAPFIWIEDANPQDIDKVDFVRPDGTPQKMTIGDYRQLADGLFHAGTNSGSQYEYVDEANRLHFYVLDVRRDRKGVLSYTIAVRSLDGAGPQARGVRLSPGLAVPAGGGWRKCTMVLRNSGQAGTGYAASDVYRLKAAVTGRGWTAVVPNALATAKAGRLTTVQVWAKPGAGASRTARLGLTAASESDPTKTATGGCALR
ncbi:M6 family metalloprotease domain-containing protein [Actinomadura parmotrematis]|uniref:M6 family metalloprotease domain-containing protein n=1 Tax=Actinomadura parmotrematis TaxID=2864039 RepID=A0ABS7FM48_9ACTN|nr:M6 family metalloprotease domain-containing protein [Actinomadura parmotrematis]MBW8481453.1 M6 family metalloprotease domain-containing protein [Actinomadura parmotrematis]